MKKILIVEDDKFFVAFYKNKLTQVGFEVYSVEDGEQAIASFGNQIPDLIILDLVMPKKDGFEVLAYLKSNDKLKNIPVIIFSALTQQKDIEKAESLGIHDYFDKSTTEFDVLKAKIESLLTQ